MSRYLEILSVQRPFSIGADDNNRPVFSVNFEALAAGPVGEWENDLIKKLSDAGLATFGTDTFIGPAAIIPTGDGPYSLVIDTGGTAPEEIHNGSIYERLSAQITVRAKSYTVARTRALAIWRELDGVRNETITA